MNYINIITYSSLGVSIVGAFFSLIGATVSCLAAGRASKHSMHALDQIISKKKISELSELLAKWESVEKDLMKYGRSMNMTLFIGKSEKVLSKNISNISEKAEGFLGEVIKVNTLLGDNKIVQDRINKCQSSIEKFANSSIKDIN